MEYLVAVIAIICIFGLPIILIALVLIKLITSDRKVRLELARQGIIPPEKSKSAPNRYRSLRNGFLCVGMALGITVGILLSTRVATEPYEILLILCASILLFTGSAYIGFYFFSKKEEEKDFANNRDIDSEIE